ncbi:hypothetical protein J1N35_028954, partial [Gossypium stocksii]
RALLKQQNLHAFAPRNQRYSSMLLLPQGKVVREFNANVNSPQSLFIYVRGKSVHSTKTILMPMNLLRILHRRGWQKCWKIYALKEHIGLFQAKSVTRVVTLMEKLITYETTKILSRIGTHDLITYPRLEGVAEEKESKFDSSQGPRFGLHLYRTTEKEKIKTKEQLPIIETKRK